jgi:hypothetical protein
MASKYFNISFSTGILIAIVAISAAMHFRHFGKDLMGMHVWRQTQTQSTIISFYEEDMNIFNPRRNDRGSGDGIFRMEFPLMQWLVAGTCKVFGNHLFISRLWMFVIGIFSVLGMYKLLDALFGKQLLAIIGAWAFNFSPSFYYHTINPMPDNLALCFSIWGLAVFFTWIRRGGRFTLPLSGLLLGLGALTKLPFILYFAVPMVFLLLQGWRWKRFQVPGSGLRVPAISWRTEYFIQPSSFKLHHFTVLLFAALPLAWYISVVPHWEGNGIVRGVLQNTAESSVLLSNFRHHLLISLPELLLNYGSVPFFLAGFYFIYRNKAFKNSLFPLFVTLGLLLSLFFLFELNMIGHSHDYYLFPFFPLLFILVGYGAYHLYIQKSWPVKAFVIALLLILPLTAFLRIDKRWNPEKPGFNKDLLVHKDGLRQAVPKDALCIAGNDLSHFIFFYYIDKKGWGFHNNYLSGQQLGEMIEEGAQYLYSDSRALEDNPGISPYLEEMILEKGTVRIYRLRQ